MTTPGERCEMHSAKRYLPYQEQDGWRAFCDPTNPGCAQANYAVIKSAEGTALDESLAAVERFYAGKGVPFHLEQKPDSAALAQLEPLLESRGYTIKRRSLWRLMHCLQPSPLLRVSRCPVRPVAALDAGIAALLRERADGEEEAVLLTARKLAGGARAFAAYNPSGAPVSICIGEGYGGAFCITDVYTAEGQRRKGYAAAAVLAMLQFANQPDRGYEDIFLYVPDGPAKALFEQTGFRGLKVDVWSAWKKHA